MSARDELRVHALIDSLTSGGAELLLSQFASVAPEVGLRFTVGYLQERGGDPAAARLRAVGVEPALVGIPPRLTDPRALSLVRQHLAAARPDVVHTHLGDADILGGVASRSLGLRAVSTLHGMGAGDTQRGSVREKVLTGLAATVRRRCMARVIAVSEQARAAYLGRHREHSDHVVTVHNGVSVEPLRGAGARVRAELGVDGSAFVVGMLSALRIEKAHGVAIDAVAQLAATGAPVRLVIVGDGPMRQEILDRAGGHRDIVTVAGHRDDVMACMDAFDVLVQPSRHEAFPTTLLEAMAAGTPIVATATGGIPEIVTDGVTGMLIPAPPSAPALARAVGRLLEAPTLRVALGGAGQRAQAERFSAHQWAVATRAVYDDLLSEH